METVFYLLLLLHLIIARPQNNKEADGVEKVNEIIENKSGCTTFNEISQEQDNLKDSQGNDKIRKDVNNRPSTTCTTSNPLQLLNATTLGDRTAARNVTQLVTEKITSEKTPIEQTTTENLPTSVSTEPTETSANINKESTNSGNEEVTSKPTALNGTELNKSAMESTEFPDRIGKPAIISLQG